MQSFDVPVKAPQGLAWRDGYAWISSAANGYIYKLDPSTMSVVQEFPAPYEALGLTAAPDGFRVILAPFIEEENERDHRYVYRFHPDDGFTEAFLCPDNSGSFLAYRGETLYLSQAWDKRIVELDAHGAAVRTIQLRRRPVGLAFIDSTTYVATVDEEWKDAQLGRFDVNDAEAELEPLHHFPFIVRSVAYDGTHLWVAARNEDRLYALSP